MEWRLSIVVLGCASALAAIVAPHTARACGGCFTPPLTTGTATVVTAHRMAMAISPVQSTLWDQFAYSGAPEDFVWVLPASADATVALADNRFFEVLESRTDIQLRIQLTQPRTSCPSRSCGRGFADSGPSDSGRPPGAPPPPVTVHHEGTVGPYETVTVSSEDPMALLTWLQDHGYSVPDTMLPTIRHYGEMGLAFIALRLRPDESIQRMQPVRVTVPGLSYVLPLRMIAAGVADKVGLRLFVFAEGRYDAQNFPNAAIDPGDVAYDWRTGGFTYDALFAEALASNGGRTWVTAYTGDVPVGIGEDMYGDEGRFDVDDDLSVATTGIDTPVLTRLEASLGLAALDRDLVLSLAANQSGVANIIDVTRELNRPPDVRCSAPPPCDDVEEGDGECAAPNDLGSERRPLLLGLVALALAVAARRRWTVAKPRR